MTTDTTPTGTAELVKRLLTLADDINHGFSETHFDGDAAALAADALEEAERVMTDIRDARVKSEATGFPMGLHPDPATWMENKAADWLARHATGQKGGDDDKQ